MTLEPPAAGVTRRPGRAFHLAFGDAQQFVGALGGHHEGQRARYMTLATINQMSGDPLASLPAVAS